MQCFVVVFVPPPMTYRQIGSFLEPGRVGGTTG
jgi:hypothetical protein